MHNPIQPFNKTALTAKSDIFKALAHPTRLYICEQLAKTERCVCEFVDVLEADFSTISKHLAVLRKAGIITMNKQGKHIYYSLKAHCVLRFVNCVEDIVLKETNEIRAAFQ